MENSINFEIASSRSFLSDLLEEAIDNAVAKEPMEVNGVVVLLKRVKEAEIRPEGKVVNIFLPLSINLTRAAGLFTVEGTGSINLHLSVSFDISNKLKLKAKSSLVSHEWLEKPKLEIGALNIPIETLVNLVLNHHESIITAKIDQALNKFSDLNTLLQKGLSDARSKVNELDLKGNKIAFDINEIALSEPVIDDGIVKLSGILSPDISVNSMIIRSEKPEIPFRWIADSVEVADKSTVKIPITLEYDFLEKELKQVLQGMEVGGKYFDVRSINIRGGEDLIIQLEIDDPIKAQVFIKGRPLYNGTEGVLMLKDLDVKVNPANFIYKLTAPIVNKFVESKMEDFFPLELNQKISNLVSDNIPESIELEKAVIKIKQSGISIDSLTFGNRSMEALGVIKELSVVSVIG